MIIGVAELILLGLLADWLARKLKLPGLIGLLLLGVVLGPYVFNLLNNEIQLVSHDLRLFALIVILLRAGLEMSRKALAKVGVRAVLMTFIPCLFEVLFVTLFAPIVLSFSYLEAAMLGSILAAVSPAVVVPLMISFIEDGRGAKHGAPTLVLAGSSGDDAVAIVLATSFIGLYVGQSVNFVWNILAIPLSIVVGVVVGLLLGYLLYLFFKRVNPRATKRTLLILGIAVFLLAFQDHFSGMIPFSALIAIMAMGFMILEKNEHFAHEISKKLGYIWIFAQLLLFALVGAQVNIPMAFHAGLWGALVILVGLLGRSIGVQLCLVKSHFNIKERVFVGVSYLPKATVQAAIGGTPLLAMTAAGMSSQPGELILAIAVLSILLTAPLGAVIIAKVGERFLDTLAPGEKSAAMVAALESESDG